MVSEFISTSNKQQYRKYVGQDENVANTLQSKVNHLIIAFKNGLLAIPENISLPDYIFSQAIQKPDPQEVNTTFTLTNLSHLIDFYLKKHSPRKAPNTFITEKVHFGNLKKFIRHERYDPLLESINVDFFERYKDYRKNQQVLSGTINKELATFAIMFKIAMKRGFTKSNILREVEREKSHSKPRFRSTEEVQEALKHSQHLSAREIKKIKRHRYLTWSEINELIDLLKNKLRNDHWLIPILICFSQTGMRRGELVRLRWEHINFNNNTIIISSRKQSTRVESEDRYIDILPELRETLLKQKEKLGYQGWVFPGPRGGNTKCRYAKNNFF